MFREVGWALTPYPILPLFLIKSMIAVDVKYHEERKKLALVLSSSVHCHVGLHFSKEEQKRFRS